MFDVLKTGSETYLVEGVDPGELIVIIEYTGGEVEAHDEILIKVVDAPFDARIRRVDFTGNQEIFLDRPNEAAQSTREFDGDGTNEWKDDDCDGTTTKNWPVAYERNSQVTLNIELRVELKEAGGNPVTATVRGVAQVDGAELVFEQTGVTLVHGTTAITGLTSQGNLPNAVAFIEPLIIEWTVSTDTTSDPAGASRHNVYTTLGAPHDSAAYPLLFTMVHMTTHGAVGATTEQGAVDGIWSQFSNQVSSRTPGSTTPQIRQRVYFPVSGIFHTGGTALRYYNEVAPGSTLEDRFPPLFNCGPGGILIAGEGRCGDWGTFLVHALDNHGIESGRVWLGVSHDGIPDSDECPFQDGMFATVSNCLMLVSEWSFAQNGGTSGDADYPYKWDEVVDERGASGQSVENPQPYFWDHVIVFVKTTSGGTTTTKLYDPSYGIGPFDEDGADYENAAISGYCKPTGTIYVGPYVCRKNPAGQQLIQEEL